MEVGRERLHYGDLRSVGANDGSHHLGCLGINVEPCRKGRVVQRLEVALDAPCRPCCEVLLYPLRRALGLQTERVAAEVGAFLLLLLGALIYRRQDVSLIVGDVWSWESEGGECRLIWVGRDLSLPGSCW